MQSLKYAGKRIRIKFNSVEGLCCLVASYMYWKNYQMTHINPMFCDMKQQGMLLILSLDGMFRHYIIKRLSFCPRMFIVLSYFSSSTESGCEVDTKI